MRQAGRVEADAEWLRGCMAFFSMTVKAHFSYEERVAFPAFEACAPSSECSRLINALNAEHVELKATYQGLLESTQRAPLGGLVRAEMLEALLTLFRKLVEHARREQEELLPLVGEQGPAIQSWMKAYPNTAQCEGAEG